MKMDHKYRIQLLIFLSEVNEACKFMLFLRLIKNVSKIVQYDHCVLTEASVLPLKGQF